MMLLILGWVLC
ncbi:hypothetical protein MTR67_016989 [Solanum verrucosum]|uniref:Uncharacterized protein n=1 Tax=Solanum verrucosum TaxID=315347 RepID=A0AAF0TLF6_SOLVR|nr:hypothetical protein MTR67_016989 [Solanum verrucosum]